MLTITNVIKKANYEYGCDEDLKVIGSIERIENDKLTHLDGSVNKNGIYIGNIYINSIDNKLKVNINNVEVENLGDVDYLAQELLRELEIAE